MASYKYYSTYDIGKIRDKIRDIRDDINRICETAMDGFNDSVWAEYKRLCAIHDAEQAMKKATKNASVVDNCASVVELACANVGEVVPVTAVPVEIPIKDVVTTEDAMVVPAEVTPNKIVVPKDGAVDTIEGEFKSKEATHVAAMEHSHRSDFVDVHVEEEQSDFLSWFPCSSPLSSPLQVSLESLLEGDIGLLDTPHVAPILPLDVLDIVDIDGKPEHTFDDPYLAYVAAYPDLFAYQDTSHGFIHNYIEPQDCFEVPLVKHDAVSSYVADERLFIRFLFDPGIILWFIMGFHSGKLDGSQFYNILLIRGRIIFSREGMI